MNCFKNKFSIVAIFPNFGQKLSTIEDSEND